MDGRKMLLVFEALKPVTRLCTQTLAGALHADVVGCMLLVFREVKVK